MTPEKERLLDLRMELVKDINPLTASMSHIHSYFIENSPKWVEIALAEKK